MDLYDFAFLRTVSIILRAGSVIGFLKFLHIFRGFLEDGEVQEGEETFLGKRSLPPPTCPKQSLLLLLAPDAHNELMRQELCQ